MRLTIIILNFIVVLFFGVFLGYTFIAKKHIEQLARDYAIKKTLSYSDPLVEKAQEQFKRPTVQTLVPSKQKAIIQKEFDQYEKEPTQYLLKLTQESPASGPSSKLLAKAISFKKKIKTHLEETLDLLLRDLRIFAISNLIASGTALFLALRSPAQVRTLLIWVSFLVFVSVCYCSYLYIDDLSFFKFLIRSHMGWWYPVFLGSFILKLIQGYGRHHKMVDEIDETVGLTDIQAKPHP